MQDTITLYDIEAALTEAEVEIDVEGDSIVCYKDATGQGEITLNAKDFDQCDHDDIQWLLKVLNEKLKELSASA